MPGRRASEAERREQILRAAFTVAVRERLDGLTVRRVAAEAGLSSGLVFFHFGSREGLLVALLDWLLTSAVSEPASIPEPVATTAGDSRLLHTLRVEIERLASERERFELFFDYWVMGTRHPEVRERIRAALALYRAHFHALADEILRDDPGRYPGVTADGLAAAAVAVVEGGAIQAVIDPEQFDVAAFRAMIETLVRRALAAGRDGPPA
jgi:AcrR family transcriptional regulator